MTNSTNTFVKFSVALIVAMIATAEPAFAQQAFTEVSNQLATIRDWIANDLFSIACTISMFIGLGIMISGNYKSGAVWIAVSIFVLVIGSAIPGTVNALY